MIVVSGVVVVLVSSDEAETMVFIWLFVGF